MGFLFNKKKEVRSISEEKEIDLSEVIDIVIHSMDMIVRRSPDERGLSSEELKKRIKRQTHVAKSIRGCGVGNIQAKRDVQSYIRDILDMVYKIDEDKIDRIIPFNNAMKLTVIEKFDILLYCRKRRTNVPAKALDDLISGYDWDRLRLTKWGEKYEITQKDILIAYNKEKLEGLLNLSFDEKLDILVQRIYQAVYGLGVIDEIRDQSINGLSIGVSGIPYDSLANEVSLGRNIKALPKDYDSIWLYFRGKEVHAKFLSFGSEKELIRVCKNSYKFNNPGQFSRSDGFKFNTTADNCRVVVFRPSLTESWCMFLRKFDNPGDIDSFLKIKGGLIVKRVLDYNIKGNMSLGFTGQQGTGKTTLMKGCIKKIPPYFTLRVNESFFETHLRNILIEHNIVPIQDIPTIERQAGLDALKKSNGMVTIIGEAAENKELIFSLQVADVGSLYTFLTQHAKTTAGYIRALVSACLTCGLHQNTDDAEKHVVQVMDGDVHVDKTNEGFRYVERITEIIPIFEIEQEKESSLDVDEYYRNDFEEMNNSTDVLKALAFNVTNYLKLKSKPAPPNYKLNNIVEVEHVKINGQIQMQYKFNGFSEFRKEKILKKLFNKDKAGFIEFCDDLKKMSLEELITKYERVAQLELEAQRQLELEAEREAEETRMLLKEAM